MYDTSAREFMTFKIWVYRMLKVSLRITLFQKLLINETITFPDVWVYVCRN